MIIIWTIDFKEEKFKESLNVMANGLIEETTVIGIHFLERNFVNKNIYTLKKQFENHRIK